MKHVGLIVFMLAGVGVVLALGVAVYTNNQQPSLEHEYQTVLAGICLDTLYARDLGYRTGHATTCEAALPNLYTTYRPQLEYCYGLYNNMESDRFYGCLISQGVRFQPIE